MSQRSTETAARPERPAAPSDSPPQDVVDFIRFCYRRRPSGWPVLYDEMCGVAARREFKGWGHEQLAARGLTFSLFDMPRLAGWVRATVPAPMPTAIPAVEPAAITLIPEAPLVQPARA